jgi:formylglycine-generating enzyme required for sulfatase activity
LSLRVVVVFIVALFALVGAQADTRTAGSARDVPARYQEAAVETQSAPPAVLTRTEPASCLELIGGGKSAFALFTNAPQHVEQLTGDVLQITAPLCADLAKGGNRRRQTMALVLTGVTQTRWSKPWPQYLVFGDVLSQEELASRAAVMAVERDCEYCPKMLSLSGGSFVMGSVANPNGTPLHSVNVPPFFLSQFPVTVGEWRRCVVAKACSPEPIGKSEFDDLPVHNVSWEDAKQYIAWLSQTTRKAYRLPTEAEWEFAARANTMSTYWWGDRFLDDRANCYECGLPFEADEPTPVGTFVPNEFGLFDMVGGVDQWVADCWHESYKGAPLDASVWDSASCRERVLRGGSWKDAPARLASASRSHDGARTRDVRYGFRVARALAPVWMAHGTAESAAQTTPTPQPPSPSEARAIQLPVPAPDAAKSGLKPGLVKQVGLPTNHRHTLGIAVDDPHDTNFAIICEIAAALGTSQETAPRETDLKVVPTVSHGAVQTIRDVFTLPSTDMAIIALVLADRLRVAKDFGDIGNGLVSITPLFTEELHVLATADIRDIRDLAGKTVNLGAKGSTSAVLGHKTFKDLGVEVNEVNVDFDTALDEMRVGHIVATLLISGKPVRYLATRTPSTGFHFLAVPYAPSLEKEEGFVPAALSHDDYPDLIDPGTVVETIGVSSALMAYNWPPGSERFHLLESFVQKFSVHLPELRSGTHHPKWKEVDFNASVPGWARFHPTDARKDQQY